MPPRTYSPTTGQRHEAEESRRRRLLDHELGDVRETISPEEYSELLKAQRKHTPPEDVDRYLGYHETMGQVTRGELDPKAGKARIGAQGNKYLNDLLPVAGPKNQEDVNALLNSPQYQQVQQKFNRQAGAARGREYEYVPTQEGYEDRPATYDEGLRQAIDQGIYPKGFKDVVFSNDVYKRINFKPEQFMGKDELASQVHFLGENIDQFEKVRQQLTENYQRLDPFGRTQYNEMMKRVNGLEKGRQEGRLKPLEYLRHMSQLADGAKEIQWKYHMKAPGGQVGDVIDKDGNGMFYQREPDGKMKLHYLSPEYVEQNTRQIGEGTWVMPEVGKDGYVQWKEIKSQAQPTADWKEKQEYTKELRKTAQEYIDATYAPEEIQGMSPEDVETMHEDARLYALKILSPYKDIADQMADPKQPNPRDDVSLSQLRDMRKQIKFEEGRRDAIQRAQQLIQERKVAKQRLDEAILPPVETAMKRNETVKGILKNQAEQEYVADMKAWEQENPAFLERMFGGPGATSNEDREFWGPEAAVPEMTRPMPERKKVPSLKAVYGPTVSKFIKESDGPDDLRRNMSILSMNDKGFEHLFRNPIPLNKEAKKGAQYISDGFVYAITTPQGTDELVYKHYDGEFYRLGPANQQNANTPVAEDHGLFGNMIQDAKKPQGNQKTSEDKMKQNRWGTF